MKKQNIPIFITFLRLLSVPFFVFLWFYLDKLYIYNRLFLAIFFSLICITDFLDGYLARKYSSETDIGKFLDPIVDKILVFTVFLLFLDNKIIDVFSLIILLSREFVVDSCRLVASRYEKKVLAANIYGKYKTFFQFLSIILFLIFPYTDKTYIKTFIYFIYYFSVFLSIFSSIIYFKKVYNYLKM